MEQSKRSEPVRTPRGKARERIDRAAYKLFSRHGIRAVGVDRIIARSGVAKMTLFRHYPSKESLALSFLRQREELWTRAWLQREVERRASDARARLLAIFDVFDPWFRRTDYEGCSFVRVLLEIDDRRDPVRMATVRHIEAIRDYLRQLATDAGIRDPGEFCRRWHLLMMGSIVAAVAGDRDAALRARQAGSVLLARTARPVRREARAPTAGKAPRQR
jgi:AcrR family transcriptional regulator